MRWDLLRAMADGRTRKLRDYGSFDEAVVAALANIPRGATYWMAGMSGDPVHNNHAEETSFAAFVVESNDEEDFVLAIVRGDRDE